MPATDALHVRTLVSEQLQGQTFRSIIDGFVSDDATRRMHGYPKQIGGTVSMSTSVREAVTGHVTAYRAEAFANAMSIAETYYLSPEMHDICQEASMAEDFPEDETILREDPPSEAGFMYLPARFRIVELRGRLMVAHAVVWINNRVWWLCDRRDPEDEMNAELNAAFGDQNDMPRYDLMAVAGFKWGEPMPKVLSFEKGVLPTNAQVEFRDVPNKVGGSSRMMFTDALVHPGMSEPISQVSPDLRFLLTVWRMMQQTITDVRDEYPNNKAVRRYADRAGIKDQRIHVIQLRRRETHNTGSGAPLSVRFVVRGHWRRVWCGPAEARYQRAIWIHPHLKGPEGAPLIHREKINALVR